MVAQCSTGPARRRKWSAGQPLLRVPRRLSGIPLESPDRSRSEPAGSYPAALAASTRDWTRAVAVTTAIVTSAIAPIAQKMAIGSPWSRIQP